MNQAANAALITAITPSDMPSVPTPGQGNFPVLSDKLVRTTEFELSKADRVRNVKGTDLAHVIVFIPTG